MNDHSAAVVFRFVVGYGHVLDIEGAAIPAVDATRSVIGPVFRDGAACHLEGAAHVYTAAVAIRLVAFDGTALYGAGGAIADVDAAAMRCPTARDDAGLGSAAVPYRHVGTILQLDDVAVGIVIAPLPIHFMAGEVYGKRRVLDENAIAAIGIDIVAERDHLTIVRGVVDGIL